MTGCVDHSNLRAREGNLLIVRKRRIVHRQVRLLPKDLVVGVQENRRFDCCPSSGAPVTWSLCACVQRIATTLRPPTASMIGCAVCAASTTSTSMSSPMSQMLLSTSEQPPSRQNCPDVTTRSMRGLTARPPNAHVAAMHCFERLLDLVQLDALADEVLQWQAPLLVEVHERREVALGQAVAVPRRLQRAAVREQVDERHLKRHVRSGHADQHHRAGEISRIEGLLPGLRAFRPHRRRRRRRIRRSVPAPPPPDPPARRRWCGWRPIPLPTAAFSGRGRWQ